MMKRGRYIAPVLFAGALTLPGCSPEQEPVDSGVAVPSAPTEQDSTAPADPESRGLDEVIQPAAVDIAKDVVGAVQKANAQLGRACGILEPASPEVTIGCGEAEANRTFYGIERIVEDTGNPDRSKKYIAAILLDALPSAAAPGDTAMVQLEVYGCPSPPVEAEVPELRVQAVVHDLAETVPPGPYECFMEQQVVLMDETLPDPILNPATEQYGQTGHWAAYRTNEFGLSEEAGTPEEAVETVALVKEIARSVLGR